MSKFGLYNRFEIQKGKRDEFVQLLLQASHVLSEVPGCIMYLINKDQKDLNCVWGTEMWESKKDHTNSLSINAVKELIAHAAPLLSGQPQQTQMEVVGGKYSNR